MYRGSTPCSAKVADSWSSVPTTRESPTTTTRRGASWLPWATVVVAAAITVTPTTATTTITHQRLVRDRVLVTRLDVRSASTALRARRVQPFDRFTVATGRRGDPDGEPGAADRGVVHGDGSVVGLHHGAHDGQTQPGA